MFETFLSDTVNSIVSPFFDPRKRVFWGYLFCAATIAILWMVIKCRYSLVNAFKKLLPRKLWLGKSGRADVWIILINHALMVLLSPWLLGKLTVASGLYLFFIEQLGTAGALQHWPSDWVGLAFTLCLFVFDDWSRYALHRLMHQWPVLWAFHQVHHSARTLSPLTVYRVHPVEGILFSLRSALVQGICTAVFIYAFGAKVDLQTILGANFVVFWFNVLGSNLRHSHIRLGYWPALERIFISPFQHQIHHSSAIKHFDKNFGAVLAIWDAWGGSLVLSHGVAPLRFGTSRRAQPQEQTLSTLYLAPCQAAWQSFWRAGFRIRRGLSRFIGYSSGNTS